MRLIPSDRRATFEQLAPRVPRVGNRRARSRRSSRTCRGRSREADIVVSRAGMGAVSEIAAAAQAVDPGAVSRRKRSASTAQCARRWSGPAPPALVLDQEMSGERLRAGSHRGCANAGGCSKRCARRPEVSRGRELRVVRPMCSKNFALTEARKAETIHYSKCFSSASPSTSPASAESA